MIFPRPKKEEYFEGSYAFTEYEGKICLLDFYHKYQNYVDFSVNKLFSAEEYELNIDSDGIRITCAADDGKFRAMTTLRQLLEQNGNTLPYCRISDKPDLKRRGYMLDISRGRMPKMDVICHLVDVLAELKYNEFQLYMDNFCFKYDAFPEYTKDFDCLTSEDIEYLDKYCSERFIDLVPNQNSFGHMHAWVNTDEYSHLALSDENEKTGTLNPLMDESVELMDKIYGSLLPHFKSKYVHIGLDEAFGLGEFQTKEACDKYGIDNVFIDYLTKLNTLVNDKYDKEIQFWDDMIISHPDSFPKFPKNAIAVEWGYGIISTQFMEERCRVLNEKGVRFYVSPGNATWLCLTSRSDVMEFNIRTAGELAKKYGAEGYLLTDWGMHADGHMQHLAHSWYPCALAGQYAWNSGAEQNRQNFKNDFRFGAFEYCDDNIFGTKGVAELMYRLGKYMHLEPHKTHGLTMSAFNLTFPLTESQGETYNMDEYCDDFYFDNVIEYVNKVRRDIEDKEFNPDIKEQILSNVDMILAGAEISKIKLNHAISEEKRQYLVSELDRIIADYERIWLKSNYPKGMEVSLDRLKDRRDELKVYKG